MKKEKVKMLLTYDEAELIEMIRTVKKIKVDNEKFVWAATKMFDELLESED